MASTATLLLLRALRSNTNSEEVEARVYEVGFFIPMFAAVRGLDGEPRGTADTVAVVAAAERVNRVCLRPLI